MVLLITGDAAHAPDSTTAAAPGRDGALHVRFPGYGALLLRVSPSLPVG